MIIGVPRETFPGERRVALVPASVAVLTGAGLEVLIETDAGDEAGFTNTEYEAKGARLAARDEIWRRADIVLQVRAPGTNPERGRADLEAMREGQVVIGLHDPLSEPQLVTELAKQGVTGFALELIPRITRAQSMDVLSSMATIAGYRAVLLAAKSLPRMFPMLMTAAGTLKPAKVFVIGAGVAGLQAVAMSRRLGAVTSGYDVRPAVAEQVESLGAKFVVFDLETESAEDKSGYAREQSEAFLQKQQEEMARVVKEHDVVITTAAIPGKKAPILITEQMVRDMAPGSVIVDLAAERGGNCAVTVPGETVVVEGVTVIGPLNMATDTPYHASQMYAKNIVTFLQSMITDGEFKLDLEDEVVRDTLLCRNGEVVNPRLRELLSLPALATNEGGKT